MFCLLFCLCEGVRSTGTGVTAGCELLCVCWTLNLGLLIEQTVLVTTEPSLGPQGLYFLMLQAVQRGPLIHFYHTVCLTVTLCRCTFTGTLAFPKLTTEDKEQRDAQSALLSVAHGGQYHGTPTPELGTALV